MIKNNKYMMVKRIAILSILILSTNYLISQESFIGNYVIFNFERTEEGQEINENFYWICNLDSLNEKERFNIYPLYIDIDSEKALGHCVKNDTISFFYSLVESQPVYREMIERILLLNKKNRKILQSSSIEWKQDIGRPKSVVRVYALPVNGKFTTCIQRHKTGRSNLSDFQGIVHMPISDLKYKNDFWITNISKLILFADYSLVDYSCFTPILFRETKNKIVCRAIGVN